uniref:Large ribosomal subunit protein uL4c n=1 Tax=Helminthora furcellata TaxID=1884666 RepID=A0A1G4NRA1_9FLOR|nr:Ribosomal protein L4 [Helminthora furcellata]SCW21181.1 Ribosomal protein L4 [Helminthora furcellata]SCW24041.1 Ribosomal protein L4 [Helminthora furcellata]
MSIEKAISYKIYREDNKTVDSKTINWNISSENNVYIVHRSLVKQTEEQRQGNASTKTRSEVRGGGRKPWKQKGTGKARAGSIRSPLWRGGGVIFGPKPKKYKIKLNNKEKRLALRNLLYNKKESVILINERELEFDKPKTQLMIQKLHNLQIDNNHKVLIIVSHKSKNLYLATRNLPNVELIKDNNLNIRALLNATKILMTEQSLSNISEVYYA